MPTFVLCEYDWKILLLDIVPVFQVVPDIQLPLVVLLAHAIEVVI